MDTVRDQLIQKPTLSPRSTYTIAIGSDHVGFEFKEEIKSFIFEMGQTVIDYGCFNEERTDYPIYAFEVASAVKSGVCRYGILICGTGVGMSLAANQMRGIRAVVCSDPYTAKLSKEHNNTNILALGARVIGIELAKMIIVNWLNATFLSERHQKRIDMFESKRNS